MSLLCPECLSGMTPADGRVVCPTCRSPYSVLFQRHAALSRLPSSPAPASATDLTGVNCLAHPQTAATAVCGYCGHPVCEVCAFHLQTEGRTVTACPDCVSTAQTAPPVPLGATCIIHPEVQAVRRCMNCQAYICSTCDFSLPGDWHLCPTCVTSGSPQASAKRRTTVGWAIGLAIWGTLGLGISMSGILTSMLSEGDAEAVGMLFGLIFMLPALAGGGVGVACLDRRLSNPPIVWVAAIWNGVILAVWVVLVIIGNLAS